MIPSAASDPAPSERASLRAWSAVVVVTILNIYAFVDRAILSLLVQPIKTDLELSDTQMGLLLGAAFVLFYSIANVPAGYIIDRFNRRAIVAVSCFCWSSVTAASGFAQNFVQLFMGRAGVGLAESTISPAAFSLIRDEMPPRQRGRAFSLLGAGPSIGSALSLIVGGAILGAATAGAFAGLPLLGSRAPWQVVLLIVGLAGIPLTLLALLLPNRSKEARASAASTSLGSAFRHMWERRGIYGLLIAYTSLSGMLAFGKGAWIPAMFERTYGIGPADVGPVLGLMNLTIAPCGMILGGLAIDRLAKAGRDIRLYGVFAATMAAGGMVLLPLMPDGQTAWVVYGFQTAFAGVFYAVGATTLAEITPGKIMGKVTAAYLLLQNIIGQALGPLVIALVADTWFTDHGQLAIGHAISAVAALVGCLCVGSVVLLIRRIRRGQAREAAATLCEAV